MKDTWTKLFACLSLQNAILEKAMPTSLLRLTNERECDIYKIVEELIRGASDSCLTSVEGSLRGDISRADHKVGVFGISKHHYKGVLRTIIQIR